MQKQTWNLAPIFSVKKDIAYRQRTSLHLTHISSQIPIPTNPWVIWPSDFPQLSDIEWNCFMGSAAVVKLRPIDGGCHFNLTAYWKLKFSLNMTYSRSTLDSEYLVQWNININGFELHKPSLAGFDGINYRLSRDTCETTRDAFRCFILCQVKQFYQLLFVWG